MKRLLVSLALFSSLFLSSCSKLPPNSPVDRSDPGSATVNIQLGKIGALAKTPSLAKTAISLSKLYITLTAQGESTIYDTIPLSGGSSQTNVTKTYGPLASITEWTLTAISKDQNDSIIHNGTQTFSVQPKQTLNLPALVLNAAYSMLTANFYPILDSVTRCELLVNNSQVAVVAFAKQSRVGDTIPVKLSYDYLRTNMAQRIKMNAYGDMDGVDTLLYSGDTLITPLPGVNVFYTVPLKWVGPSSMRPVGQASMNVVLGAVGTITLQAGLQPDNRLWGNVVKVAAGSWFSLFLKSDKTLWACGWNYYGQLGNGTATNCTTTVKVMSGVQAIAAGFGHSLIIKSDSTLWACGYNQYGQLGDGTITDRHSLVQIMSSVKAISAGNYHSLILKNDGTLWACGYNQFGQLGTGDVLNHSAPVQVMSGVQAISAGGQHSLFLKNNSTLWACGWNILGQLGTGDSLDHSTPIQVMNSVQAIWAGGDRSFFLKNDGTLWACGNNQYGDLGDGTTIVRYTPVNIMSGVQQVAGDGNSYSLFLKSDGTLWGCGNNNYGNLGDGTTTVRYTPISIMSGVQAIETGDSHSLILKTNGTLWGCGINSGGALGDGTTITRTAPIQLIF